MMYLASIEAHLVLPSFVLSHSEKRPVVDALHPESSPG
jgi:hypothetical protein